MREVSPESSFYGSDEEKARLTSVAESDDITRLLHGPPTLTEAALRARRAIAHAEAYSLPTGGKRHNMYEGNSQAWQLDEPVSSFLDRLKPSTAAATTDPNDAWIYAANPDEHYQSGDLAGMREAGEVILSELLQTKNELYGDDAVTDRRKAYHKYSAAKTDAQGRIKDKAQEHGVVGGKWMLFVGVKMVDEVWAVVARGTIAGELGYAAKVSARDGDGRGGTRLICIYTTDFADEKDVKRVLVELQEVNPIDEESDIYYKADAYTHLGITSGNEWEIPASMYSSKKMLSTRAMKRKR